MRVLVLLALVIAAYAHEAPPSWGAPSSHDADTVDAILSEEELVSPLLGVSPKRHSDLRKDTSGYEGKCPDYLQLKLSSCDNAHFRDNCQKTCMACGANSHKIGHPAASFAQELIQSATNTDQRVQNARPSSEEATNAMG